MSIANGESEVDADTSTSTGNFTVLALRWYEHFLDFDALVSQTKRATELQNIVIILTSHKQYLAKHK